MYVLCFRMRQMIAVPRLKSQLQLMRIEGILGSPFKPLQVMSLNLLNCSLVSFGNTLSSLYPHVLLHMCLCVRVNPSACISWSFSRYWFCSSLLWFCTQVCLPSIVEEFLRLVKANCVFSLPRNFVDYGLLESEHSKAFGGLQRFDMFFPFDPCLLSKCDRYSLL